MRSRPVLPAFLAALAALIVAGCGAGGDGASGGGPASVAPAGTPLYLEFTVRPTGETKTNVETLARKIAGIEDLGALIFEELEESAAEEGEEIDFETEIEPWLGEKGGFIYPEFSEGDFEGFALAVEVTDSGAAEGFIENQTKRSEEEITSGSFEGIDFQVDEDGEVVGVVGDLIVLAEEEAIFKEVVTASNGESLAEQDVYSDAVSANPDESAADVYVDIGGLIRVAEASGEVDEDARRIFENAGIELDEATATASLIPGSDRIEVDIASNAAGENPPSGDASELLGSLPATAVFAFAAPDFGDRFDEGIDQIDEQGIPSEGVQPHQLKKTLKEAGIDLEAIAGSIGDAGGYVTGNSESSLGGAVVLETENANQAKNTVSNIGLFLRSTGIPGITRIGEGASGFSIRSPELGRQPVVVAAKGSRIAIGYGLAPALASFEESGQTLADLPAYEEAVAALGDTPIAAFVDGSSALNLISALIPSGDEGFEEAEPYLEKIEYLAIGSEASDALITAKLIVGIGE
ncbi:MAG TPA: DUF3352 domain-containing protein [Solirubrobacterales bacterium]|nr:DUF3352 domain-containing protein [Solirubrobacterales bacterium]